eukprot:CAMPEP_0197835236 /NCGR_PEP_ID=MMETSP1437-20131217/25188_1 /TAXON_ID=49252 ORGANISM="Eucampia antarctica, Strain CCMP1452" /NCGR_SAMPLE_ID=MMETSP1437 /ASSEMBLY_ACC=CAM_ASM_001096 /LENGTH=367 /DNA_ID=CAMNT_0043440511 /DNA_START=70 /DNA_END=1170 /DNA_ORIENTATION=+
MADNTDASDPANLIGKAVKIINLASRQELNGHLGKVMGFKVDRERYTVQLSAISPAAAAAASRAGQSAPQAQTFDLKAHNLVAATLPDRVMEKFETTKTLFRTIYGDPAIREQVRRLYTSIKTRLPPGIKPEHVGIGALVLSIILVRFIGFSKFIMLFCLLSMVPLVCMPDIAAGTDAKTCLKKFPTRWREILVQATGYTRISEKAAIIGFGILLLLSLKILFTQAAPIPVSSVNTESLGPDNTWGTNDHTRQFWKEFETAEDMYKLGFADAEASKEYGASLPVDAASIKLALSSGGEEKISSAGEYESNDWQYQSPQSTKKQNKFGFTTIIAIVSLMRTLKELAFTPDNRPNFQLFLTNLKMLESW